MRKAGARTVLASLGPDGAVLVEDGGVVVAATAPSSEPRSTVGAGDCLLAGFLAGGGAGREALAEALAWAAAAVERPGSGMPDPADIARRPAYVTDQLDDDRTLTVVRLTEPAAAGRQGRPGGRPSRRRSSTMETTFTPPVEGTGVKAHDPARRRLPRGHGHAQHRGVHRLGLITALFIPDGWLPNENLAALVEPDDHRTCCRSSSATPAAGWSTASAAP